MTESLYITIKYGFAVVATFGLYSILYRENKFYRLFEHIFLGLASGWALKTLVSDVLYPSWWQKMLGTAPAADGTPGQVGYYMYAMLLPLGLLAYFVFNEKHNWVSRIPIGIILGFYSGQQVQIWWNRFGPQIADTAKPILPTSFDSFTKPETVGLAADKVAKINAMVYPSQAISNLIFVVTVLSVLVYFLFSFKQTNKAIAGMSTLGRWLLMIGFGAIFGSTVMMRFTLLIDRMYFVWVEWLQHRVLHH